MTLYQYISEEILKKSWEPILRSFVTSNKLKQLLSLQPIGIYENDFPLDFEGSIVNVEVKSYVENIIEKRLSNPFQIFDFFKWGTRPLLSYKFQVFAVARMDFVNAAKYLTQNFANIEYYLEDGKYKFTIHKIALGYEDKKLWVDLEISGTAKWWKITKIVKGKLRISGNLKYLVDKKTAITQDLDYKILESDFIILQIDKRHHAEFRKLLIDFLRVNVREELFNARIAAQEEINKAQNDPSFIVNGALHDLEIERLYANEKGIRATLVANGRLHLNR